MSMRNAPGFAVCITVGALGAALAQGGPMGLTVRDDGALLLAGKPCRAMGVNYFDAFLRTLEGEPADETYEAGFAALEEAGIPFARINGGGFWPVQWKLYLEDRDAYFARFDRVVASAEEQHVGLIPSLFWCLSTMPDLAGEPCDQWGNPESRTHSLMRQYIEDVVTRYRSSPAIWGWEFGNEYNLAADLPNASEHRPPVWPDLGTATERSERDELTHAMIRTAIAEFAREVRKHDPDRAIFSGNSIPRASAWHQMTEGSWTADPTERFMEMLAGDNPDPVDTLTIHCYEPGDFERLTAAAVTARIAGKPLFVGEFGVSGEAPDAPGRFALMIDAIEASGAALAAVWVYDRRGDEEWGVTADNNRAYQLREVAAANKRMQASAAQP